MSTIELCQKKRENKPQTLGHAMDFLLLQAPKTLSNGVFLLKLKYNLICSVEMMIDDEVPPK